MLREVSQTQRDKYHVFFHKRNLDQKIQHDCKSGLFEGRSQRGGKKSVMG
jgi:hypothetical protein